VVVEDSAPGVAAGRAAGMGVLGVVRVPGAQAALAEADHLADAVSLEAVLAAAR
jgi:beta-phosphoglucomutase-like phosphatase (HAD superfamily)